MAYKATPVKDLPTQKEIVEKIRQAVAVRESTPTQPSDAYKALVKYNTEKKESAATPETNDRSSVEVAKLTQQKKKEDQIEEKVKVDSLQVKKDRAEKALKDFDDNKEIDWTDTNQRKQYDAERKRLQEAVDAAGSELAHRENQRVRDNDMAEINAMPDEDREHLRQYIENRDKNNEVTGRDNLILNLVRGIKLDKSKNALTEKYGVEKVDQLASTYSRYLKEEQAKLVEADTRAAVQKSPWAQQIPGAVNRMLGGQQAAADRFAEMFSRDDRYSTLAPYVAGDLISLQGNTVTGETAKIISGDQYNENGKMIHDGGVLRQGAAYLYQGGMSMVDSFMRTAAGGGAAGGAALAACNAFSQTVSRATQQGASPDQAYKLGAAVAGMEYISEQIPMDEVFKLAKGGKTNVLKQAFKQAGIEITTEELSLFGSMAAEAAILQEKSTYKQQIGDLVAHGASYEEAKKQADKAVWEEVKQTAYVSGFAGGFSGGGAAIVGNTADFVTATAAELAAKMPPQEAPAPLSVEQQQLQSGIAATLGMQSQQLQQPETNARSILPITKQSGVLNEIAHAVQNAEKGATNRMAEAVMNDPVALTQIQQQSGIEVTGTKAERRKAVKDALNRLYGAKQTTGSATTAETSAQPPVERSVAENQSQNSMQDPVEHANNDPIQNDNRQVTQRVQPVNEPQQISETGTVGAAKSKFRHEVRESGVYANTFANANNADLRAVGEDARAADPNFSRYDVITEGESLEEARLRTGTAQDRYVEHRQLMAKDGWSGADNDTAMRLLTAYRKEGKADRLRELAKKQKEMGTQGGQLSQSFAKYSREDATVAVLDAVEVLEKMGVSDVPKKFWKKGDNDPTRHANVGDSDDYSDTAASRMENTQQENMVSSKRKLGRESFEAWKTSVTKSMLEIANDIEAVQEDDVDVMRGIVRQLAQFRRTTAWFGTQNRLTKNADRILEKMDFDTAKTIAKAQLAMIPDDFRKRSAGETAKTIRIHNMLSALTTTERNTIGNATMGIMDAFSDSTVARAMDVAMSRFKIGRAHV